MFIAAAVPITSVNSNKKLGILFGGCLINNNNEIVDQIKSRVFQGQIYEGKDIGSATIFLMMSGYLQTLKGITIQGQLEVV